MLTRAIAVLALIFCSAANADAMDRRVRVVNDSSHAIVAFHGANSGLREWPESLLGDEILPAGGARIFSFEDGSGYCRFRFRAVFEDGVELIRDSVNVC